MENDILIVFFYTAIGDYFSYNSMFRYFALHFSEVLLFDTHTSAFGRKIFKDCNKIKFITNNEQLENVCKNHIKLHAVDVKVYQACQYNEIVKKHCVDYFHFGNLIGNYLKIPFENNHVSNNATGFYVKSGLNADMRFSYFHYERDKDIETNFFNKILTENAINGEKYSVICEYGNNKINKKYINNKHVVNVNNLAPNICDLLLLIENADEIHVIENSIALMIYMLQMANLFNKHKCVNFHTYARKDMYRTCTKGMLDNSFALMMACPKLDSWNFIMDDT